MTNTFQKTDVTYEAAKSYRNDDLKFQVIRYWTEESMRHSQNFCMCARLEDAERIALAMQQQDGSSEFIMSQDELENQLAYLVHGAGDDRALAQAKISRHCKELAKRATAEPIGDLYVVSRAGAEKCDVDVNLGPSELLVRLVRRGTRITTYADQT